MHVLAAAVRSIDGKATMTQCDARELVSFAASSKSFSRRSSSLQGYQAAVQARRGEAPWAAVVSELWC